jgi:DNA-binding IclR family transcriptional regulator
LAGARAFAHYARPGQTVPAHCTAAGKAFLAHLPGSDVDRICSRRLERYTEFTLTSRTALLKELEKIRQCGYAINDQEYETESCGVAAVVRNFRGEVVAALTAAVPKHRFDRSRRQPLIDLIMSNAAEFSKKLGYLPEQTRSAHS